GGNRAVSLLTDQFPWGAEAPRNSVSSFVVTLYTPAHYVGQKFLLLVRIGPGRALEYCPLDEDEHLLGRNVVAVEQPGVVEDTVAQLAAELLRPRVGLCMRLAKKL